MMLDMYQDVRGLETRCSGIGDSPDTHVYAEMVDTLRYCAAMYQKIWSPHCGARTKGHADTIHTYKVSVAVVVSS